MEQLVDKVEIVFEKESAIFHDGDYVTGLVLIRNNDDIAYKCEYSILSHHFTCLHVHHDAQLACSQ